jgi:hypothetical protein
MQLSLAAAAAEADRAAAAGRGGAPAPWLASDAGGAATGAATPGEEYELDLGLAGGPGDEEGLEGDLESEMSATWTR